MDWFRYHTTTLDNRKVQTMPRRLTLDWLNFMCLQRVNLSQNGTNRLPDIEDIAFRLRITPQKATAIRDELVALRFIDRLPDGTFAMHDWEEWQRPSSDDAAERKRRQRARKSQDMSRDTSRDESQKCLTPELERDLEGEGEQKTRTQRAHAEPPPEPRTGEIREFPRVRQFRDVQDSTIALPPEYEGFDFPAWIEGRWKAHPLPGVRTLAEQAASQLVFRSEGFLPSDFDRAHDAWCVHWAAGGFPSACNLEKFIADGWWRKMPPARAEPKQSSGIMDRRREATERALAAARERESYAERI